MKTQFRIMACAIAVLVTGTVTAAPPLASTAGTQGTGGQVKFTGEITDASCNVDSSSANQSVDLGKWAKTYFTGTGVESTKTAFHIKVKDCPNSVKQVAVLFDGNTDAQEPSLLKVNGGATGVGIKLYEYDQSKQIIPGSVSEKQPVTSGSSGNGSADLIFYANYEATGATVATGLANAVADFNMIYN